MKGWKAAVLLAFLLACLALAHTAFGQGGLAPAPTMGLASKLPASCLSGTQQYFAIDTEVIYVATSPGPICTWVPMGSNGINGVFNVKNYGAVGGAQKVSDAIATNTSKTITSATANFQSSDAGKIIYCVDPNSSTTCLPAGDTIQSVQSTSSITVAVASAHSTNPAVIAWAPQDDTAGFLAAFNAALGSAWLTNNDPQNALGPYIGTPQNNLTIPPGNYMISGRWFPFYGTSAIPSGLNVIGAGEGLATLFISPFLTANADGRGLMVESVGNIGSVFSGLSVDGLGYANPNYASSQALLRFSTVKNLLISHFVVGNVGATTVPSSVLDLNTVTQSTMRDSSIQFCNRASLSLNRNIHIISSSTLTLDSTTFTDCLGGPVIENSGAQNSISGLINVSNSTWEAAQSGAATTFLINSVANFVSFGFYTGTNAETEVDGTSIAYFTNASVGVFDPGTGTGRYALLIATGGQVYSSGSLFFSDSVGPVINNSGTFNDLGGNLFKTCTSGVCSPATNANRFSGNLPIFPLTPGATTQLGARQIVAAVTAPTFAVTGFGTSPTVTVQTGATDAVGSVLITAGTAPAATGTFTLTFTSATPYGTNPAICTFTLINGTGSWNALAQVPVISNGGATTASVAAIWNDNSVALTAASTYGFNWECYGH